MFYIYSEYSDVIEDCLTHHKKWLVDPPTKTLEPSLVIKESERGQTLEPSESKYAGMSQRWLLGEMMKENKLESPKAKFEEESMPWPAPAYKQPLGMSQRLNLSG